MRRWNGVRSHPPPTPAPSRQMLSRISTLGIGALSSSNKAFTLTLDPLGERQF